MSRTIALAGLLLLGAFAPLLAASPVAAPGYTVRGPIYIGSDADFNTSNGVVAGNGTSSDPYVIEGWNITAPYDDAIRVQWTSAHFVIRNVLVQSPEFGIHFWRVTNGAIALRPAADQDGCGPTRVLVLSACTGGVRA